MVDRVWNKVKRWKENFLSKVGREVLIKAAMHVFPNYIMSCYKILKSCCNNIEAILSKFWWGAKNREEVTLVGVGQVGCL